MKKLLFCVVLIPSLCLAKQDFEVKDGTMTVNAVAKFTSNRLSIGNDGTFTAPITIGQVGSNPAVQIFHTGRVTIGDQASDNTSFAPLYVFGQVTYSEGNVIARFRSAESDGGEIWIEGGTGQHATLQFNLGNTVEKYSIKATPATLGFYVNDDQDLAITLNNDGGLGLKQKTSTELQNLTPGKVGELYINTTTNQVCTSTGTTQGAFGCFNAMVAP